MMLSGDFVNELIVTFGLCFNCLKEARAIDAQILSLSL